MKMRTFVTRVLALLASLWASGLLARAEAVVGQPAPDFTARDIQGQTHKLGDFKGRLVVLESYNRDCPFCANHFNPGAMQELQGWARDHNVAWLVINSVHAKHPSYRNADAAKKEFTGQKMKATAWIDDNAGVLGKTYGFKTTPHLVIIDRNGLVAYKGAIDDQADTDHDPRKARNYVREALIALLAGEPVKVKATKPYGCSVKYAD